MGLYGVIRIVLRFSVVVLVFLLVVSFLALSFTMYLSGRYLDSAIEENSVGNSDEAQDLALTASRLDPFSPRPMEVLSLVHEESGRLGRAEAAMGSAAKRGGHDYYPHLVLGLLRLQDLQDYEGAVRALREAESLNPNDVTVSSNLAEALSRDGEYEEAIETYEELLAGSAGLEPGASGRISLEDLYRLGRLYVVSSDPERGREVLQEALVRAEEGLREARGSTEMVRRGLEERVGRIEVAIADSYVIEGRYELAREELSQSTSEQAPAILSLLEEDPGLYRRSVEDGEVF